MRVSIVNPRKKARKAKGGKKKRRFTKKARQAAMRNLKKARSARKKGKKGSHARKSRKGKKKKSKKAKRKSRKGKKKGKRKSRKSRKSRKTKRKSKKSRRAKGMPRGKRVRPAMYRSRSSKRIRHSPKSRYARKGYRFNPSLKQYLPASVKAHMPPMQGAKWDLPHIGGGVVGFFASGYTGGYMRQMSAKYSSNSLVQDGASLVGNVVGTEVPAIVVHWALGKAKKQGIATSVARGMRVGGYVALGLNALSIVAKAIGMQLPFRALSEGSPATDLWLSGMGDWDLALSGLGEGGSFVETADYAGLGDDEGLLSAEIAALSNYLGEDMDEFGMRFAGVSNDYGMSP